MSDAHSAQKTWKLRVIVMRTERRLYDRLNVDGPEQLYAILSRARDASRLDSDIAPTIQPLVYQVREGLRQIKQKGADFAAGDVSESEEWFNFDHLQKRQADCQALDLQWSQVTDVASELDVIATGVLNGPLGLHAAMTRDYLRVKDMERWTEMFKALGLSAPTHHPLRLFYQSLSVIEMMYRENRVVSEQFSDRVKLVFDEAALSAGSWLAILADRYGEVMKWKYCLIPRLELDVAEAVAALETELECSEQEAALIAQNVPLAVGQMDEARVLMDQLLADFVEYHPYSRVDEVLDRLLILLQAIEASLEPLWVVQVRSRANQHVGMSLTDYYGEWDKDH